MSARTPPAARTVALTVLTLCAFAANSVLCRLALRTEAIDPLSFTVLRLGSGALVLLPLLRGRSGQPRSPWSPGAALALLVYAIGFSLAYVWLTVGTGSLLLFGSVQVTMIGAGLRAGERPTPLRALGLLAAVVGVVVLVAPGLSAPEPLGAVLMAGAGIAWGAYSLLGRGVPAPMQATARNFLLAAPFAALVLLVPGPQRTFTTDGVLLALVSGGVASALGYVIWYSALRGHSATSAAIVQLTVPVLAGMGGVVFLGERPTTRLFAAGALTLGGVLVAVLARRRPTR